MTTTIKKIPHNIKTTGDIGICGTCNSELDFEVRKECISCKECASCRKSFNCWRDLRIIVIVNINIVKYCMYYVMNVEHLKQLIIDIYGTITI